MIYKRKQKLLTLIFLLTIINCIFVNAQSGGNKRTLSAEEIRGSLRAERLCYDVKHYDLDIAFNLEDRSIEGKVSMTFDFIKSDSLQIDLFSNIDLDSIVYIDQQLGFSRYLDAVFIDASLLDTMTTNTIKMYYHGIPIQAKKAPWDGGFVWSSSSAGNEYIAVACEGTGASLWWPNKDHLSDEPDSMDLHFTLPDSLDCISNGNMIQEKVIAPGIKKVHWKVSYPINNYNVTFYIGQYEHFQDQYISLDQDTLPMDYYVFPENLEKAKQHFMQANKVLEAYEHYFGKYPFWKDGYAMVESTYLGMEHQGAIAYGNRYLRGYMGGMIPADMDWDYIIVHETGHEYFGNSISCVDHAEMWIHESFTTYMEALFVEYTMSYDDAERYLQTQKHHGNEEPIIGPLGVNHNNWQHSDHYFKGSWILHTLRNSIADDTLWFQLLRGFYEKHKMSNITSDAFFVYVNEITDRDYDRFFEQYLFMPGIPKLQYQVKQMEKDVLLSYKLTDCVDGFDMPISIFVNGESTKIYPNSKTYEDAIIKDVSSESIKIDLRKYLIEIDEVE